MKILFASSEAVPFASTGGLGDVASALPKALTELGQEVAVVIPCYGSIDRSRLKKTGLKISIDLGGEMLTANILEGKLSTKTKIYLLEQKKLYARPNLYGDSKGDYPDNDARFIFFNRAVMELPRLLGFEPDIIHLNDWQCGLVPLYLKIAQQEGLLKNTRSVFTLHNLAYQGHFAKKSMKLTGLPGSLFNADGVEMYGKLALMKTGIIFADTVTAVSPTYAKEILNKELGFGLETILGGHKKKLFGILNGIDDKRWDPATDRLIPHRYSLKNLAGKTKCRASLLKKFGLENRPERPVIGIVSRLIEQKGFDIIVSAGEEMMKMDISIVALGSGQPEFERYLRKLQKDYPKRVAVTIGYDDGLAHRIEAGSDLFLMPSRFEPCGLNQMYSLRYGTIPVVRATGGLNDTVTNWNGKSGNGFRFIKPTPRAMLGALRKGVELFSDKSKWKRIVKNAMSAKNSWKKSAKLYLQLYNNLLPSR